MSDHPDTVSRRWRQDRKNQEATNPWWQRWQACPQAYSQEVDLGRETRLLARTRQRLGAGKGARASSLPLSPTPGLGGALGLEGGQPDVADPGGCGQEAAAGVVPEHQSGGREGAARTCIVQAWLPIESPRPAARVLGVRGWDASCGFQAGSNWA